MTLIEILIAVFILTVGILSCLLYFSAAMNSTEIARDTTVATTHAEYVLEDMRAKSSLTEITGVNWTQWALDAGLSNLPGESIGVTYANPLSDPLNISVSVHWTRRSRASTITLQTELTK